MRAASAGSIHILDRNGWTGKGSPPRIRLPHTEITTLSNGSRTWRTSKTWCRSERVPGAKV